jgi:hypothetical protein
MCWIKTQTRKGKAPDQGRSPIRGAKVLAGQSRRRTSGGEAVTREDSLGEQ